MSNDPTVNPAFVKAGVAYLESIGIPAEPILKSVGLSHAEITDMDIRMPLNSATAFLDLAAEQSGDPFFRLQVGTSIDPKDTGVLGHVLMNAETVGDTINYLERYVRLYADNAEINLTVKGDTACLNYEIEDPRTHTLRQNAEIGLGFLLSIFRVAQGSDWHPSDVHFKNAQPKDISGYQKTFRARLHFGSDMNALIFPRSELAKPIPKADPRLLNILKSHSDDVLAKVPQRNDLISDVRAHLIHTIHDNEPRISDVALALGCSVRTLQRRLNDNETSFSTLLDDVRQQMAVTFIDETDLSLQEIAFLLGYAEFSSFHHAFRRWTGATVTDFRRRLTG